MGSACCVPAKDKSLLNSTISETVHRNVTCSPTWSFRWENRRRVAGEVDDFSSEMSHGISENFGREIKGTVNSGRSTISDEGSPIDIMGTPASQKSEIHGHRVGSSMVILPSDDSMASSNSLQVKNLEGSPASRISFSTPSPFSMPIADPFSTRVHHLPPNSTPSRRARRSPGFRLLRQVSDSRILGLKSPNDYSESDGRPSFVQSTCSVDLTAGSLGGSSDGWSMRTFSELVASSHRERWSFDSGQFGFGKIGESSGGMSYSPFIELQACGACSKLLKERSSWSCNEVSISAVLVCGHVYHAECLETLTQEADKYDPTCPICMVGESQVLKMSRKALKMEADLRAKSNKMSRNRVIDSYLDCDYADSRSTKQEGKDLKMEASSSSKPFMKRRFSIGKQWRRSMSESDSARRKGFWARYRKYLAT